MPNPQKILIVEDDQENCQIYKDLLRENGYEVTVAKDGAEGLLKAKQGGYDLILLDIMLPKIDGLQFLGALKEDKSLKKNGPIILLTNLSQESVLNEGLRLGARAGFLKADLTPSLLLTKIKELLHS